MEPASLSTSTLSASLLAQTVKRLPAKRETWVQSLGREDPLEKEIATRSQGWRSLVGYGPCGHEESGMTGRLHFTPAVWGQHRVRG